MGIKVPSAETQQKGTPADEQGAGKRGAGAESPGVTLGDLTSSGAAGAVEYGGGGGAPAAMAGDQENLTPEAARAKDIAPAATQEGRIPETEREEEGAAGLGKGVGVPPGSAGRETGQTPNN
jgi:hypothetical protein